MTVTVSVFPCEFALLWKAIVVVFVSHSNAIAGESALDRLASGLGGKTMLPHITSNIPQMLQNGSLLSVVILICHLVKELVHLRELC